MADLMFASKEAKYKAIVEFIKENMLKESLF
jgi:hypothetical protein